MSRIVAAMCMVLAVAAATSGAATAENPVRSHYIVVLKPNAARSAVEAGSQRPLVSPLAGEIARAHDGGLEQVFQYALKGFAVELTEKQAARLADDARVDYVEPDQVIQADATQSPATWGLDRIDQRDLPLSNSYTYNQTGRASTPTSSTPGCSRPIRSSPAASATASPRSPTVEARPTATATAPTSPARSAARPTASPSWPRSTPSASSAAPAPARPPA